MNYYTRAFSVLSFLALVLFSLQASGQCDTNRYRNAIFNQVYVHQDVQYGSAPVWNFPYADTDLYMDIYEPVGDTQLLRPLMIWVHPGAFLTGDKTAEDMVALCDSFAQRGYVTVSLGYRLGYNPLSPGSAERAVYRGTQDLRAAIRYLYEFAPIYQIDTNYTLVGGSSAGGFSALHLAFLDDDEAPASIAGGTLSPDLGCLDCSGNTYNHTVDVDAIVNMWGAIGDTSWIDTNEQIPTLLIHGTNDGVIPFEVGNPFGLVTTPVVYGSDPVHTRLGNVGIERTFLPFYGQDHEPHGTSNGDFGGQAPTPYWDTIIEAVSHHYLSVITPETPTLMGPNVVCALDTVYYSVQSNGTHYCWNVSGGTIINHWNDSVAVVWDVVGSNQITVVAKNEIAAASLPTSITVTTNSLPNPSFTHSVAQSSVDFLSSISSGNQVLWDFGDGTTSNQPNPTHTYQNNGVYTVTLTETSPEGCTHIFVDSVVVFDVTGLAFLNKDLITLYPNPASSILQVQGIQDIGNGVLYNALGSAIKTVELSPENASIDISNLETGVYSILISTGSVLVHKRFVVSR